MPYFLPTAVSSYDQVIARRSLVAANEAVVKISNAVKGKLSVSYRNFQEGYGGIARGIQLVLSCWKRINEGRVDGWKSENVPVIKDATEIKT